MHVQLRIGAGAVLMLAILGVGAWFLVHTHRALMAASQVHTGITLIDRPVVMRTPGGLLEVAIVRAHERFRREDTRQFWGIPLGTTVSEIQAIVVYRYHIELAAEWPLTIRGHEAIVRAPELRPSLPVAFDSANLEKWTRSGWARFNKDDNLTALERSLTPELEARASAELYRRLATDAARQTVREFVSRWLLREQGWTADPKHRVQVIFPGESWPRWQSATGDIARQP